MTFCPLKSFDGIFVVFGRVVEGLHALKKFSEKQDAHSLLPTTKLKIVATKHIEKIPTEIFLKRQKEIQERKPHMQTYIRLSSAAEIQSFVTGYRQESHNVQYVKGPEIIEIRNLKDNDDLYTLSELPLSHVHTVCFRDCKFHVPSQTKVFKYGGFFKNAVNWEFFGCELTKEVLKAFFINKFTKPAASLIVEPKGKGLDLFKTLTKWRKLEQITRFAYIGSMIGKEELGEFLGSAMFNNLQYLDLSHTKLYDDGLTDFVTKFSNHRIKGIYLGSTGISAKLVTSLLSNKAFSNLEVLDVSNNFNMDPAVSLIASSKHITKLRELYLRNTYLKIDSVYDLVCSHNFGSITRLDISNNFSLKDDFSFALVDRPFIRQLEYLNLENTDISNETLKQLSDNRHLKALKVLDISNNPKVKLASAFEEIENPKFFQNLHKLHVANLGLDQAALKEVTEDMEMPVDTSPAVTRDFSDYLEHLNLPPVHTEKF